MYKCIINTHDLKLYSKKERFWSTIFFIKIFKRGYLNKVWYKKAWFDNFRKRKAWKLMKIKLRSHDTLCKVTESGFKYFDTKVFWGTKRKKRCKWKLYSGKSNLVITPIWRQPKNKEIWAPPPPPPFFQQKNNNRLWPKIKKWRNLPLPSPSWLTSYVNHPID